MSFQWLAAIIVSNNNIINKNTKCPNVRDTK